MKKWIDKIRNAPFVFIFIVALIIYFPLSISRPAETNVRGIITAIAFDSAENDEIQTSVIMLTPLENASFSQTNAIITAKGDSVANTFTKIGLYIGKTIALAHTEIIMIGEELANRNLAELLNFVGRSTDINNNTPVIIAEGQAKELLESTQKLGKSTGLSLQEIINYNEASLLSVTTTLEAFYKSYYSENSSSVLSLVKLVEEQQGVSINESSGQSSQDQESASGQTKKESEKLIDNDGSSVLIKNGKLLQKLFPSQTRGLEWVDKVSVSGFLEVENVSTENLDNAKLTFEVRNKRVKYSSWFQNKMPVILIDINVDLELVEVYQNEKEINNFNTTNVYINKEVASLIEHKIKQEFSSVLKILKDNNADAVGAYDILYAQNKDEFKKYLKTLEDENDYLKNISFRRVVHSNEYI